MNLFDFLLLIGGLAFFLYGMNVMSQGLERLAGGKLESILRTMTARPFGALLLGAGVTAVIQSSSAVTVMLVGLVNSGIMDIGQTVGVIMGSNIGTTITAWLLSLVGIESSNVFIQLLKPANFSLIFAFVGIMLIMLAKNPKKKDIGKILIGFATLMYGMEFMSDAVEGLKNSEGFISLLTKFENPILGIAVGALFTAIIQSSSASVGVLQALAVTGTISYGAAIPIIMGQNIGTCVTALISSIGVSKNARKVSVIHISFNLIGTVFWCALFYILNVFVSFDFLQGSVSPMAIAIIHSIFNIATTILLFPFNKLLVKIADKIIKADGEQAFSPVFIDERLLNNPSMAISECSRLTEEMCAAAHLTVARAIDLIGNYSEKEESSILKREDLLDIYEDKLGTYLMQISNNRLSEKDNAEKFKILHCIGDFERIGDHAVNLVGAAREISHKGLSFPEKAKDELKMIFTAIKEILQITSDSYSTSNISKAKTVEPLEQVIDHLLDEIKIKHILRLQNGETTIEMGFILSDILTNLERISDHCSNIAVAIIETGRGGFETHEYLQNIKSSGNSQYTKLVDEFAKRYSLPNN